METAVAVEPNLQELKLETAIIKAIEDEQTDKIRDWLQTIPKGEVDRYVDVRESSYKSMDAEVCSHGMTALHYAAFYCKVEIVDILLQAGADPASKNKDEETVLHVAMQSACEDCSIAEISKQLLSKSCKYVDEVTGNDLKWTALLMAVYLNLPHTVEILLRFKADPNIDVPQKKDHFQYSLALAALHENIGTPSILEMLLKTKKCDVNWNRGKYRPLHVAAKYYKAKNLKLLVDHKADIMVCDGEGWYPIHYILSATSNEDFLSMLTLLRKSINAKDKENGFTPLHLALVERRTEYARILRNRFNAGHKRQFDKQKNLPIHHLCQLSDVQDLVEPLGEGVYDTKNGEGQTPLHLAIIYNNHHLVRILLGLADASVTYDDDDNKQHHLVHVATTADGTDYEFQSMIEVLEEGCKDFDINQGDCNNRTALHWALDMKMFTRAKILLQQELTKPIKPNICDTDGRNCLHIAMIRNAPGHIVQLIIKKLPQSSEAEKARDKYGNMPLQYLTEQTPLSAVLALEHVDIVRAEEVTGTPIIEAEEMTDSSAEEMTRTTTNKQHKDAPLITAIKLKKYDIVKLLLVKGAQVEYNTIKEAVLNEDEELAYILVRHAKHENLKIILNCSGSLPLQVARHRKGSTSLPQDIYSELKQGRTETTLFQELIRRMPKVAKEALQRCMKIYCSEDKKELRVEFDYCYICSHKTEEDVGYPRLWEEVSTADTVEVVTAKETDQMLQGVPPPRKVTQQSIKQTHMLKNTLKLMVDCEETQLLKHPVVRSYLYSKWTSIGCRFYFINLLIYALFLLCLSTFSLIVNNPQGEICTALGNNTTTENDCGSHPKNIAAQVLAICTIVLAGYHLIKECVWFFRLWWFRSTPLIYFKDLQNYNEIVLYTMSVVFVSIFRNSCGCPTHIQWQIGIFVVLLGWINMIFFASNFPGTAIYVIMFKEILQTFFKLTLFAILLVTAFSLILFMMFYNPNAEVASFQNFGYSVLSTMNMITGGVGFNTLFQIDVRPHKYKPIPYYIFNFFMWTAFLILFPIVFKNLLLSLAVGDVKKVRDMAELKKLALQVKIFTNAELVLPNCIKNRLLNNFQDSTREFNLKEKKSFFTKMVAFLFGREFLENIEENAYAHRRTEEREDILEGGKPSELDELREKLNELCDLVQANESGIKKCMDNDEQLMRIVGKLR